MKKTYLLALALTGWMSASSAQAKHGGGGNGGGTFTSSDGTTGTYVETLVTAGTTTTDTIVFTTTDLSKTGTDTTATTINTDGSRTVVYTHLALGVTVPSILSITFPAATTSTTTSTGTSTTAANCAGGAGGLSVSLYGTGSLTSAAGALATLSAFVTNAGGATITSIDFTTTLLSLARELRVVENSGQSKVITTIDVDLTGVETTETLTLTATASAHGHH